MVSILIPTVVINLESKKLSAKTMYDTEMDAETLLETLCGLHPVSFGYEQHLTLWLQHMVIV
jgi:hypothetical protein